MFEVLKSRYSTWKRYSRTVQELESLTSRELADLGISRSDIPRLAREAARQWHSSRRPCLNAWVGAGNCRPTAGPAPKPKRFPTLS